MSIHFHLGRLNAGAEYLDKTTNGKGAFTDSLEFIEEHIKNSNTEGILHRVTTEIIIDGIEKSFYRDFGSRKKAEEYAENLSETLVGTMRHLSSGICSENVGISGDKLSYFNIKITDTPPQSPMSCGVTG